MDTEIEVKRRERLVILDEQRKLQQTREQLRDIETWCRTVASNLQGFTYEQRRTALLALGVQVKVWRTDHEPRYEITARLATGPIVSTPTSGWPTTRWPSR